MNDVGGIQGSVLLVQCSTQERNWLVRCELLTNDGSIPPDHSLRITNQGNWGNCMKGRTPLLDFTTQLLTIVQAGLCFGATDALGSWVAEATFSSQTFALSSLVTRDAPKPATNRSQLEMATPLRDFRRVRIRAHVGGKWFKLSICSNSFSAEEYLYCEALTRRFRTLCTDTATQNAEPDDLQRLFGALQDLDADQASQLDRELLLHWILDIKARVLDLPNAQELMDDFDNEKESFAAAVEDASSASNKRLIRLTAAVELAKCIRPLLRQAVEARILESVMGPAVYYSISDDQGDVSAAGTGNVALADPWLSSTSDQQHVDAASAESDTQVAAASAVRQPVAGLKDDGNDERDPLCYYLQCGLAERSMDQELRMIEAEYDDVTNAYWVDNTQTIMVDLASGDASCHCVGMPAAALSCNFEEQIPWMATDEIMEF
eukprot:scaffold1894_cov153-Pinguiococcus_pyrenoidosus.AAC.3